ncbi:MAG: helix-turn-helix transcriptional regulator [Clostridia bacterium]|nr:helix-turn-helix transcriptional regulator [Clostridia bacterium]MBQ1935182.1 helix-turn-helix transcriptional regulator [Clostridia bacterium]MBQ5808791.1 helix-turn-helix transcriptional regulator [Clostridia bacterium]
MYIDYSKLWKLLVDKGLGKTDLMEITGISSRVLAKLSKNETVTTDTIARICSALNCDVGDIMECVSEERLSVYLAFKKHGKCVAENELFKTVEFTVAEQKYTVYQSKQTANKATHIHCGEDGAVHWERFYAVGTLSSPSERSLLIKPCRSTEGISIVLIKGKPAVITGLDENGFVSSRGIRKSKSDVYVMSETAFKLFAPQAF